MSQGCHKRQNHETLSQTAKLIQTLCDIKTLRVRRLGVRYSHWSAHSVTKWPANENRVCHKAALSQSGRLSQRRNDVTNGKINLNALWHRNCHLSMTLYDKAMVPLSPKRSVNITSQSRRIHQLRGKDKVCGVREGILWSVSGKGNVCVAVRGWERE